MTYTLKLAVSVALVVGVAALFDVSAALAQLAAVDPGHAALALALFVAFHGVGAVKLKVVLPQRSTGELFAFILMAQAYALLLPGQLAGEAMKAYRLARGAGAEVGRIVSSVAFDKMTAMVALLATALGGLLVEVGRYADSLVVAVAIGLVGVVAFAGALALEPTRRVSVALLDGVGWRSRLADQAGRFLATWRRHAAQPRLVAASVGWGVAAQLVQALASLILSLGFGIELTFAQWCVVIGVLTVVLLAPVTIGGIGLREASLIGLLGLFGVAQDQALALALAVLAIQIVIAGGGLAVDLLVLRNR